MYVAKQIFTTKGVGQHKEKLASFEMALRKAGIAQFNLVRVSSIYPPRCKNTTKSQGLKQREPGQIVHVVMSENATNEPHRLIAASVGVATPRDSEGFGYLSEHHSFGQTSEKAGDYAEDIAAEMLATVLGVEFDADSSWDEKREIWRFSGQIYRSSNTTQTAVGNKKGLWTAVIAAAVLLP